MKGESSLARRGPLCREVFRQQASAPPNRRGREHLVRDSRNTEQDRCADRVTVKYIARTMRGFKAFRHARNLITGIEAMPMIRKGEHGEIKD